jgi:hypothetical protein
MRNAYRILVGKPERKGPLVITRRRWDHNIRLGLREIDRKVWIGFIWIKIGTSSGDLL